MSSITAKLKELHAAAKVPERVENIDDLVSAIPLEVFWDREALIVAAVNSLPALIECAEALEKTLHVLAGRTPSPFKDLRGWATAHCNSTVPRVRDEARATIAALDALANLSGTGGGSDA